MIRLLLISCLLLELLVEAYSYPNTYMTNYMNNYPVYGPDRYPAWTPVAYSFMASPRFYPYYGKYDVQYYNPYYQAYQSAYYPYYYADQYPLYFYNDGATDTEVDTDEYTPEEKEAEDAWYDNFSRKQEAQGNGETNRIFLQNLILAQMMRNSANRPPVYGYQIDQEDYDDDSYVYGEPVSEPSKAKNYKEDEDVKELHSLADQQNQHLGRSNRKRPSDKSKAETTFKEHKQRAREARRKVENKWIEEKRENSVTSAPWNKGQDEVVIPRPSTSIRTANAQRSKPREPSAYDSIKQLLHMQDKLQKLEKDSRDTRHQKRSYVLNEDALVDQLGQLKKNEK